MMKKIGTIMLGLLVVTSMLGACKKKEVAGPTGPAGPAGNANVKSLTFVTTGTDWIGNQTDGYVAIFDTPIITADIVATGAVMCYINYGATTVAMPYSYFYGGYTRYVTFEYSTGMLYVNFKDDDGFTPNPGNSSSSIKVVAISSTGMKQHPDLDLTDYEAVKKAFDL